jgi:RimJ/RimL family protein N-acetyltransferase
VSLERGKVTLRPVRAEDCKLVWEWANDPLVRQASFRSEPIPWDEHRQWFSARLRDPLCRIYVAVDESGRPVGQIRFSITGHEAVANITIGPAFRKMGYGAATIQLGVQAVVRETGITTVHAYVKKTNLPSRRAFLKGGFIVKGSEDQYGFETDHLLWEDHDA